MKKFADKTKEELLKELKEGKESLRTFRFGISGSKIRNVREGRNAKKNVARVMTELNRKK